MTDAELAARALKGDREAFGSLVERYRHQVYGLAYHYIGDFEAAKDLAQEAFVQAYLKLEQLRAPDRFAAWLRALTVNVCRMWLRRQVEVVPLKEGEISSSIPSRTPYETLEQTELNALVHRAIDALSERQRLTVTMFYIDGLTYEDIAEFMGESVNAVWHLLRCHCLAAK